MSEPNKNRIYGVGTSPMGAMEIQGVPMGLVADLESGGYVQIVPGENPVGPADPGPRLAPGTMLVVLPAEVAAKIRPMFRLGMAKALGQLIHPNGDVLPGAARNPRL